MDKVNPLKRRRITPKVPYSVFPANKTTRTSMPIGRLVPLYTIEMMQGNHWKCGVQQLTRFLTMKRPILNQFEINYGAFFVPYRSLDILSWDDRWTQAEREHVNPIQALSPLNAEKFFNPATPNSLRHHPECITPNFHICKYVGSLYDHLGYAISNKGENVTFGAQVVLFKLNGSFLLGVKSIDQTLTLADITQDTSYNGFTDEQGETAYIIGYIDATSMSAATAFVPHPFLTLQCCDEITSAYTVCQNVNGWHLGGTDMFGAFYEWAKDLFTYVKNNHTASTTWSTYYNFLGADSTQASYQYFIRKCTACVAYALSPTTETWKALGVNMANTDYLTNVYNNFYNYLSAYDMNSVYHQAYHQQNIVPLLAYARIYGDYFLNENFVYRDDFFHAVSFIYQCGYYADTMYTEYNAISAVWNNEQYKSVLGVDSSRFPMITDFVNTGRCLPVLWQNDYYTSILHDGQPQGAVTISNGDSIPTLFYKRMLQKFRDLIGRLGYDYKENVEAIYGSNIDSRILWRSQVIGFRKFDVTMQAIAQTSQSDLTSTLGEFAGYAYSNDSQGGFEWSAEENGLIMVLAWIRPKDIAYKNHIDRRLLKSQYTDYLLPQFGGVGYQDVSTAEVNGGEGDTSTKFGVQERYFEYMLVNNECSGDFRTINKVYSIDRERTFTPSRMQTKYYDSFLFCDEDDLNRCFVDTTIDPVLVQAHFEGSVTRQLPAVIRTDF